MSGRAASREPEPEPVLRFDLDSFELDATAESLARESDESRRTLTAGVTLRLLSTKRGSSKSTIVCTSSLRSSVNAYRKLPHALTELKISVILKYL